MSGTFALAALSCSLFFQCSFTIMLGGSACGYFHGLFFPSAEKLGVEIESWALFSFKIFLVFETVALSFLFDKHCPIIE